MSEFAKLPVGKKVRSMDVSPQFSGYTGVEIVNGDGKLLFRSGDVSGNTGRVITIENEWGTQEQADDILASLKGSNFRYQPYSASGVSVTPASELGDGITINGVYSGICTIDREFNSLALSDVSSPQDEAIDHEFPFVPPQDREYRREISGAYSRITQTESRIDGVVGDVGELEDRVSDVEITADGVSTTVTKITKGIAPGDIEGVLQRQQSELNVHAADISAKVGETGKNGDNSFSWQLKSTGFFLQSGPNRVRVFEANKNGVTVTGTIKANEGFIGSSASNGFSIKSNAIYNGMDTLSSTNNGVYIGKDGIGLGGGKFKVTSSGVVTLESGSIKLGKNTDGTYQFVVTNGGKVTARDLTLVGGSLSVGKNADGSYQFVVTTGGKVTAKNLVLQGGSIKIGDNFTVDSSGNITAKGTVKIGDRFQLKDGNIYADNITLSGTIYFPKPSGSGYNYISADNLRDGAQTTINRRTAWNGTTSAWNGAVTRGGSAPDYFHVSTMGMQSAVCHSLSLFDGNTGEDMGVYWKTMNVVTSVGYNTEYFKIYSVSQGMDVYKSLVTSAYGNTTKMYYLGR